WAAGPALACLTPAPGHSCCHAMAMDCDSAVMIAAHPCCQFHDSGATVPLGNAVAPEHQVVHHHAMVSTVLPPPGGLAGQTPGSIKTPPPRSLSGVNTILRI